MNRDMDLVREILFKMEADTKQSSFTPEGLKIEGYTQQQVAYHMEIMTQAGLLHVKKVRPPKLQTPKYAPKPFAYDVTFHYYSISSEGHDFLDAVRDNGIWKKAKGMLSQAGVFGREIITAVLVELAKSQLHLPPG